MNPARGVRSRDLALVCGVAVVGLLVSIVAPGGWVQAVALAPLALAAPGYALTAALFPPGAIDREDRVVYSFVFSIGAAGLGGLVLQLLFGLDRGTWLALLLLIMLVASAVAQRRRVTTSIRPAPRTAPRPPAGALWAAIVFLVAIAIGGAAIAIAAGGVREQQGRQRFASLWALPAQTADGAPRVEAGLWNHGGPLDYRLDVSSGGRTIQSLRVHVPPSQRWHTLLSPAASPDTGALLLTLYHGSRPYRSVELNLEEP